MIVFRSGNDDPIGRHDFIVKQLNHGTIGLILGFIEHGNIG